MPLVTPNHAIECLQSLHPVPSDALLKTEIPRNRRQDGKQADLFGLDLKGSFQKIPLVVKEQEEWVGSVVHVVDAEYPTAFNLGVPIVFLRIEGRADVCPVVGNHAVPISRPIDIGDPTFEEVSLNGQG